MEELLSRILTLLPIALLVFLRLFYDANKRKKKAARAGQSGQQTSPGGSPHGARPAAVPSAPKKEGFFSSLLKMMDGKDYNPDADSLQNRVLLHYEEESYQKAVIPAVQAVKATAAVYKPAARHEPVHTEQAPAPKAPRPQLQLNRKGLRQAVVMAEVLGEPRSLKPYDRH